MHFVYIIYSETSDKYYKGYSLDPIRRLEEHNEGRSRYTRHFIPWTIVYIQSFITKTEALQREKSIKKYSKTQLRDLIGSKLKEL